MLVDKIGFPFFSSVMTGKDGKEEYDVVGGVLSPTLTVDEKTDEEVYKEAFDHFDGNHSKTIPTSVSSNMLQKKLFKVIEERMILRALSTDYEGLG